jgi:hypothetical protein
VQRRAQLEAILKRGASRLIRFSESFNDANALLAECSRRRLEGIVSKRMLDYLETETNPGAPSIWPQSCSSYCIFGKSLDEPAG